MLHSFSRQHKHKGTHVELEVEEIQVGRPLLEGVRKHLGLVRLRNLDDLTRPVLVADADGEEVVVQDEVLVGQDGGQGAVGAQALAGERVGVRGDARVPGLAPQWVGGVAERVQVGAASKSDDPGEKNDQV